MAKEYNLISSKKKLIDFNLKEVSEYKDLIFLFVKRTFVSRYKQTILGPMWAIIQPLLTTLVFTVVFGSLANLTTLDIVTEIKYEIPGFLFYLAGTVCWAFFSGCITETSNTFIGNAAILGKVYFPRLVMPISTVFSQLISFGIQFCMFIAFWLFYLFIGTNGIIISPKLLLVPLLILQIGCLGMGCGIIISALTTKYRDLAMLVSFGVQLWQYATPIAYGLSLIPSKYYWFYMLNPMTSIIVTFRDCFFAGGYFNSIYYALSWIITLMILIIGIILFNRIEKTFMDTI